MQTDIWHLKISQSINASMSGVILTLSAAPHMYEAAAAAAARYV
jgi:hypothetical protein